MFGNYCGHDLYLIQYKIASKSSSDDFSNQHCNM